MRRTSEESSEAVVLRRIAEEKAREYRKAGRSEDAEVAEELAELAPAIATTSARKRPGPPVEPASPCGACGEPEPCDCSATGPQIVGLPSGTVGEMPVAVQPALYVRVAPDGEIEIADAIYPGGAIAPRQAMKKLGHARIVAALQARGVEPFASLGADAAGMTTEEIEAALTRQEKP